MSKAEKKNLRPGESEIAKPQFSLWFLWELADVKRVGRRGKWNWKLKVHAWRSSKAGPLGKEECYPSIGFTLNRECYVMADVAMLEQELRPSNSAKLPHCPACPPQLSTHCFTYGHSQLPYSGYLLPNVYYMYMCVYVFQYTHVHKNLNSLISQRGICIWEDKKESNGS